MGQVLVVEDLPRAQVGRCGERVPRRVQRAVHEGRVVLRALRGLERVVMLVGVLRARPEPGLALIERRVHPPDDVTHDLVVAGIGENAVRVRVDREQLGVVLEHLLEVRDLPLARRRIAEESALDVVVHPAASHRAERLVEHRGDIG